MKYLSRNIIKEIESHFYNWNNEREELNWLRDQLSNGIEGQSCSIHLLKASSLATTEQRMVEIERHMEYLQGWIKLVDTVRNRLANTPQLSFITMLYTERLSEIQICEKLFIERRTFYNWKSDFLGYAAMKACEMGLISV